MRRIPRHNPDKWDSRSREVPRSDGIPEYYHRNINFTCVDCGKECVFTVQQQREWFEAKNGYYYQRPIRCAEHYEEWKFSRNLKIQMDDALVELRHNPDSEELMRAYALSIVDFHKQTGNGKLETAIHLLRKLPEEGDALLYCREQVQLAGHY